MSVVVRNGMMRVPNPPHPRSVANRDATPTSPASYRLVTSARWWLESYAGATTTCLLLPKWLLQHVCMPNPVVEVLRGHTGREMRGQRGRGSSCTCLSLCTVVPLLCSVGAVSSVVCAMVAVATDMRGLFMGQQVRALPWMALCQCLYADVCIFVFLYAHSPSLVMAAKATPGG